MGLDHSMKEIVMEDSPKDILYFDEFSNKFSLIGGKILAVVTENLGLAAYIAEITLNAHEPEKGYTVLFQNWYHGSRDCFSPLKDSQNFTRWFTDVKSLNRALIEYIKEDDSGYNKYYIFDTLYEFFEVATEKGWE